MNAVSVDSFLKQLTYLYLAATLSDPEILFLFIRSSAGIKMQTAIVSAFYKHFNGLMNVCVYSSRRQRSSSYFRQNSGSLSYMKQQRKGPPNNV